MVRTRAEGSTTKGNGVVDVRLVDLEVIKKYSLAVRRDTVPAEELLAALDASREIVLAALGVPQPVAARGSRRPSGALPSPSSARAPRRPRPASTGTRGQTPSDQTPSDQSPSDQTRSKGPRSAPAVPLERRSPPRRRGGPAGEG
ncbi:MAG: hypothetical protein NVS3B12_08500 [Acidimicrobiales bacterium]